MMTPLTRRRTGAATTRTALYRRRSLAAALSVLTIFPSLQSPLDSANTADAFTLLLPSVKLSQRLNTHIPSQIMDGEEWTSMNNMPIRRTSWPFTRLTHLEELLLLRKMRSHPSETSTYQRARQSLLVHNLPLVQSIVTKVLRSRPSLVLTQDDLLHEGTIGLAEAIDRYNFSFALGDVDFFVHSPPTMSREASSKGGAKLGTYATFWIRARVLRAIQSREHALLHLPEHLVQASHRLAKAASEMGLEWDVVTALADYDVFTLEEKELREKLRGRASIKSEGLFRQAVRVRALSRSGSTTQLESWMSSSCSTSAASCDEDTMLKSIQGKEHIRKMLAKFLMPREVEVLSLRYGLLSSTDEAANFASSLSRQQWKLRNYQAEAEEGLFGPNGMLSHYSETSNDSLSSGILPTSQTTDRVPLASKLANGPMTSSLQRNSPQDVKLPPESWQTNTLLPFKEIGKQMKFSGEYCRQTCAVALNKLMRAAEEGRLAESDFILGW